MTSAALREHKEADPNDAKESNNPRPRGKPCLGPFVGRLCGFGYLWRLWFGPICQRDLFDEGGKKVRFAKASGEVLA